MGIELKRLAIMKFVCDSKDNDVEKIYKLLLERSYDHEITKAQFLHTFKNVAADVCRDDVFACALGAVLCESLVNALFKEEK